MKTQKNPNLYPAPIAEIRVRGAREHNLKNISVRIPRDSLTVITGPSGSGKTSLAFDTLYAEGQRRYVESLSAYARQFIEQTQKPDVDSIDGLSPAISIEQKTTSRNPRSTVGTVTEVYDYLRVLYTRVGRASCPDCRISIQAQGMEHLYEQVMSLPPGSRVQILAPIVIGRKGEYKSELDKMRREGFLRARIDGAMVELGAELRLDKRKRHTIEIVIDRLIVKPGLERRVAEALDVALRYADLVSVHLVDEDKDLSFSKTLACPRCAKGYPEPAPRFFSFNSPYGACSRCRGLGFVGQQSDEPEERGTTGGGAPCPSCRGTRLRREALAVSFGGKNIAELAAMSVDDLLAFLRGTSLSEREHTIAQRVLKEVRERLSFLQKVGLGYLSLDRPAASLSGGEGQRIRLAAQVGSSLTGVLYVLDEPSIGLHPRDHGKLLDTLETLRDAGNTVVVVEHDEDTIRRADHVIDMGPGAGAEGGFVVAAGTVDEVALAPDSPTGRFLRREQRIVPRTAVRVPSGHLRVKGAREHNLKNLDVSIPLGMFSCLTGVSGSGKSTLLFDIVFPALSAMLRGEKAPSGKFDAIQGTEDLDKIVHIDQQPLGRTPRSNPCTYTGIFSVIRDLFARTPDAKLRGFGPGRFSFNVKGGRCEECGGDGLRKIEMHFLPDVYVPCEICKGKRYNRETLAVRYKGLSIADVLNLTVREAREFFQVYRKLRDRLQLLEEVGLGYLRLGQSATTLSGGEAQRIKLAKELNRKATGRTLYLLDEPTTGLHFVDVERLLGVLNSLVDAGNTVVVIEHNPEMIKCADHLIDLGPEGGEQGGRLVGEGTPGELAATGVSATGKFLAGYLATH